MNKSHNLSKKFRKLKVAIVHELLVGPGGAENVVLELLKLFPQADVFTAIYNKERFERSDKKWQLLTNKKVYTSKYNFIGSKWWQKLPNIFSNYRNYFFLWPKIMESFNLDKYDLVISSHYLASHGVITQEHTLHVTYTHTPARYFYSHYHEYMESPFMNKGLGKLKKFIYPGMAFNFRKWDAIASLRPDFYIANSTAVKQRIKKYYNRESVIIHPPVSVSMLQDQNSNYTQKHDFYVTMARLVPQKKIDIIIKAFIRLKKELYIMGKGPELFSLQQLAKNAQNIHLLGFVTDKQKAKLLKQAKAFIFASYEDFGIAPIEALASGTPLIAYNKGGTLDYVIPNKTGVFFNNQTPESIIQAVKKFESVKEWDYMFIKDFSKRFSEERFLKEIAEFIFNKLKSKN